MSYILTHAHHNYTRIHVVVEEKMKKKIEKNVNKKIVCKTAEVILYSYVICRYVCVSLFYISISICVAVPQSMTKVNAGKKRRQSD